MIARAVNKIYLNKTDTYKMKKAWNGVFYNESITAQKVDLVRFLFVVWYVGVR